MGPWGEKKSIPKELLPKESTISERVFGGIILGVISLILGFILLAIFTAPISIPPIGWQGVVFNVCGLVGLIIGLIKPNIAFFLIGFFGIGDN